MVCTLNYTDVIQKALKTLDKKNFAFIIHGGSFPAAAGGRQGARHGGRQAAARRQARPVAPRPDRAGRRRAAESAGGHPRRTRL